MEFKEPVALLAKKAIWIKILAYYLIINGAFTALSVVGLVIAWLPIWTGLLLLQFAKGTESYATDGDPDDLLAAFNKLAIFFQITGITIVVVFALAGLIIVAGSIASIYYPFDAPVSTS